MRGLSSGDVAAHFSIRGGRHNETLILLDGLEIYEPYHLKGFNEGAISVINVETIEGVELMTGGFPAVEAELERKNGRLIDRIEIVDPDATFLR